MTILHAFKSCAVALVIGVILATPVFTWRAPRLFVDSIEFASLPANDESLQAWFGGHENVLDLELHRIKQKLQIKYVRQGLMAGRLDPDWSDYCPVFLREPSQVEKRS